MKEIYTKTGDEGQTSLRGGVRVDKDDIRIETNGQIDHLNSLLGLLKAVMAKEETEKYKFEIQFILELQRELMNIMSHVATPNNQVNPRCLHTQELIERMEGEIDKSRGAGGFIIPGENTVTSMIHVVRTQSRTAERRLWTLSHQHAIDKSIPIFFNRLSDYLFALTNRP